MVLERTAEIPHRDRFLPVVASNLPLRCFLLPRVAYLRVLVPGALARCCGAGFFVVRICVASDPAGGTIRLAARKTLFASGVQRLVPLQVAEEDVGRLGGRRGEVDVLRLQDVGDSRPAS